MQHSGDPETLSTLLESYNEVKKVFDSYKEMLEHGNYHRARAASEKVSHRGTGELALIDFEVRENLLVKRSSEGIPTNRASVQRQHAE